MLFHRPKSRRVSDCGAQAGSVLCGSSQSNYGLRLRLLQDQLRGNDGAIRGPFFILDVGDNVHSDSLQAVAARATDAAEVLAIIRRERPSCVNVVNANILVPEETRPA